MPPPPSPRHRGAASLLCRSLHSCCSDDLPGGYFRHVLGVCMQVLLLDVGYGSVATMVSKHQSSGLTEIYLLVRFEMPILILMTRSR
jgi:hypothetical protein